MLFQKNYKMPNKRFDADKVLDILPMISIWKLIKRVTFFNLI